LTSPFQSLPPTPVDPNNVSVQTMTNEDGSVITNENNGITDDITVEILDHTIPKDSVRNEEPTSSSSNLLWLWILLGICGMCMIIAVIVFIVRQRSNDSTSNTSLPDYSARSAVTDDEYRSLAIAPAPFQPPSTGGFNADTYGSLHMASTAGGESYVSVPSAQLNDGYAALPEGAAEAGGRYTSAPIAAAGYVTVPPQTDADGYQDLSLKPANLPTVGTYGTKPLVGVYAPTYTGVAPSTDDTHGYNNVPPSATGQYGDMPRQ